MKSIIINSIKRNSHREFINVVVYDYIDCNDINRKTLQYCNQYNQTANTVSELYGINNCRAHFSNIETYIIEVSDNDGNNIQNLKNDSNISVEEYRKEIENFVNHHLDDMFYFVNSNSIKYAKDSYMESKALDVSDETVNTVTSLLKYHNMEVFTYEENKDLEYARIVDEMSARNREYDI